MLYFLSGCQCCAIQHSVATVVSKFYLSLKDAVLFHLDKKPVAAAKSVFKYTFSAATDWFDAFTTARPSLVTQPWQKSVVSTALGEFAVSQAHKEVHEHLARGAPHWLTLPATYA